MDVELTQDGSSSPQDSQSSDQGSQDSSAHSQTQDRGDAVAQALAEIDKMEKFKFQGREWTPKDLEKAMLRQKDYTQKTQTLAEERKALEQDRKYYENLHADLNFVRQNPKLASEFVKLYPEKFHGALKQVLSEVGKQSPDQQSRSSEQAPDVELLSRLAKLENNFTEQEIAKNTTQINSTVERLSSKYPDAIPEMVVARIFEAHNSGIKLTDQLWEDTFKSVDSQLKDFVKNKYGDLVKKQTQANARARDVDGGGGTPGRAPKKFGSLKEVTDFAVSELTGKR